MSTRLERLKAWILYRIVHTKWLWKLDENYISREIGPFVPRNRLIAWIINRL